MTLASGGGIHLRDATPGDADLLDEWARDLEGSGGFNDFGQPAKPIDRDALAAGPLRNEHNGLLVVVRADDGRPIGTVGWRRVAYGANDESAAWQVGIEIVPDARGRGFGTDAQRALAEYLFATTPVGRVEASTDVDNVGEQRALEKAGFVREGVARGAQYRAGSFHDLALYARLRDDG